MQYKFQPEWISIAAGSIDEESVHGQLVGVSEHIFLGEKAAWFEVPDDGAERFERFSGNFQEQIDTWKEGAMLRSAA